MTEEKQIEVEKQDQYFMNLALEQAQLAYDAGEVPVGALRMVVSQVSSGRVI